MGELAHSATGQTENLEGLVLMHLAEQLVPTGCDRLLAAGS